MFAWKHSILMAIQKPVSISSIKLISTSLCQSTVQTNYYDVLDVPRTATQKEIREAYINKSRELHPDVQDNEIESKEELKSNAKFAVVNEAYETLGKPKERREYNKKLRMEAARDIKSQYYHHNASESNYEKMVDLSQMSARDRAKAMGYDVDPRMQYGNDSYLVAGLCLIVIVVGFSVHYKIAKITSEKHGQNLDRITGELLAEANIIRTQAMNATLPEGKSGNASHRDWIMRNDPTGEALKAYDEAVLKKKMRKSRQIVIDENHTEKDNVDHEKPQNVVVSENRFYADGTPYSKNE